MPKAKPEDIVKCFDFDAVVYCKICGEEIHYPSVMPPDEYVFDHLYKHVSKLYGKRRSALKGKDDSNRRKHKS
jgi:hypothetical protein